MEADTTQTAGANEELANGHDPVADTARQERDAGARETVNGDENDEAGRNRSTIGFPYGSLADAEQVASAVQQYGGSATADQVASAMNSTTKSGAFRMKTATARIFGVLEHERGTLKLSQLGRRLVDPTAQEAARVEAFLTVPLFLAIFTDFQGTVLPGDNGLEHRMAALGVSPKQTAKARQAFQRSAERAGFFRMGGRDRLVKPPLNVASSADTSKRATLAAAHDAQSATALSGDRALPDPVQALWGTLLRDGASWSADQTHQFVEAARQLHEVLAQNRG